MITVLISKEANYKISLPKIQKQLSEFLNGHGVLDSAEVSVSIVGEETMLNVSNEFLKDNAVHDVLSFPSSEATKPFLESPDGVRRLGDIIVCYEMAQEEAEEEEIPVERKVIELINHGALHLMGIHHE